MNYKREMPDLMLGVVASICGYIASYEKRRENITKEQCQLILELIKDQTDEANRFFDACKKELTSHGLPPLK